MAKKGCFAIEGQRRKFYFYSLFAVKPYEPVPATLSE
jgi:hypothetical protein